jgi:hypothetical protein
MKEGAVQGYPIVIIDEANKLMQWSGNYDVALSSVLDMFVAISKQQRRCHVWLLSSEYAYVRWLESTCRS